MKLKDLLPFKKKPKEVPPAKRKQTPEEAMENVLWLADGGKDGAHSARFTGLTDEEDMAFWEAINQYKFIRHNPNGAEYFQAGRGDGAGGDSTHRYHLTPKGKAELRRLQKLPFNEAFVKYVEFEVRDAKGKLIGTFYTDISVPSYDIKSYARSLTPNGYAEKNWNVHYSAPSIKGTDTPTGKYVKPSDLKKATKEAQRKAKEYMDSIRSAK